MNEVFVEQKLWIASLISAGNRLIHQKTIMNGQNNNKLTIPIAILSTSNGRSDRASEQLKKRRQVALNIMQNDFHKFYTLSALYRQQTFKLKKTNLFKDNKNLY